jgi:quinol monooxygenase YgiN
MGFVVIARWTTRPGEEVAVRRILEEMTALSAAEPGCRLYQAAGDPSNARDFTILEIYDDEAAYQAHLESDHFGQLAAGNALPRLANREREFYETIP